MTVYETGRFVKSPSVFLKKVEFSREYAILDGVAVPKTMQTSIETRFWGPAQLDIQFSDFHREDPLFALNRARRRLLPSCLAPFPGAPRPAIRARLAQA